MICHPKYIAILIAQKYKLNKSCHLGNFSQDNSFRENSVRYWWQAFNYPNSKISKIYTEIVDEAYYKKALRSKDNTI